MKEIAKIILAGALAYAAQARAEGDLYMYFQIVDNPTVINLAGQEVAWNAYRWNGLGVNGARVVSMAGDVASPLAISYYSDKAIVDTVATMIPMPMNGAMPPLYAALPSDPSGLSFAIELGNYNNGTWTTLATSGSLDYNSLENSGYTYMPSAGDLALATLTAWAPTAYSVPEPSSGLLILLGASLLALKRRRR